MYIFGIGGNGFAISSISNHIDSILSSRVWQNVRKLFYFARGEIFYAKHHLVPHANCF